MYNYSDNYFKERADEDIKFTNFIYNLNKQLMQPIVPLELNYEISYVIQESSWIDIIKEKWNRFLSH